MYKRILVTGGGGMIGMELCRQLVSRGHEVHLFDLGEQIHRVSGYIQNDPHLSQCRLFYGSILDKSSIRAALKGCDAIVHLAAVLGVQRSEQNKLQCMEININGTMNVLDEAVKHQTKKVVFASSSEVYGEPPENPITEKTPTQGKTVYGVTKMTGEELCKAYAQRFGIDFSIVRYFNSYGPFQTAQFVISKFVKAVMDGNPPIVYGGGHQVRSYTFVSDTVEGTIQATLKPEANGEVFNIGNGKMPITLKNLANLVIRIAGKEGEIEAECLGDFKTSDRTGDREIFERFCDAQKSKDILGWEAKVPLEEGIRKIMEEGVIFDRWSNLYDELT